MPQINDVVGGAINYTAEGWTHQGYTTASVPVD